MGGGSQSPNEDSRGGVELSVVEFVGQRLVEQEVGHGLGIGGVEARNLVDQEIPLRRPPSRGERRRPVGEVEVQKDGG